MKQSNSTSVTGYLKLNPDEVSQSGINSMLVSVRKFKPTANYKHINLFQMKKIILSFVLSILLSSMGFGQTTACYLTTNPDAWSQAGVSTAFTAVYGAEGYGWTRYIFASSTFADVFPAGRKVVFVEGGGSNTTTMKNWMGANWSSISAWVSNGNTLIIDAASNDISGAYIITGSGVTSTRILQSTMTAYINSSMYPTTSPTYCHPLLKDATYPSYATGNYGGNYIAHNVITGTGLKPIFTAGDNSGYTMCEQVIGSGRIIWSGCTLPWFSATQTAWTPNAECQKLVKAMISWATAVSSGASVTTTTVSSITTTSASGGGNVTSDGGASVTERGVVWSTSSGPSVSSFPGGGKASSGTGTGSFTVSLTSLTANTTYYYRAYATNSTGTTYGTESSFISQPANPTGASASPSTVCNGTSTSLSVTGGQGTVYWYTGSCGGTYVGIGNPLAVSPSTTTIYYARNYNSSGGFSSGCVNTTVTVTQPASVPTSSSASATEKTTASLSWGASSGLATITYYWAVGTSTGVTYDAGYAARGTTTNLFATATGLTQSTTYYLRVKAANSCNVGGSAYVISSSFRTHSLLTYTAGANGTISGTSPQTVANTTSGSTVTAVPNTNYHFVNWSDGSTTNPRTDANVTNSISVTANFAINILEYSVQPTNTIAGNNIILSVRIKDSYGNTMTNSDQDITLSISTNPSAGVLTGTTLHTTNGVVSTTLSWINKVGTGYKLTASASPLTGATSSSFNITPAVIHHFTVAGITASHVAGTTTTPTVTAYDVYDNVKTNYLGTIVFTSNNVSLQPSAPTVLPASYTFIAANSGVKSFTNQVSLKQTGTGFWVKAADGASVGQQSGIAVTPASIHSFRLVANGTITAGVPFTVTASVYDEYENIKTNYSGANSVNWTTTATSSRNGTARIIPANGEQDFTAGVATIGGFTFYNSHETPTITITDGPTSSPGTTAAITVNHAILENFLVEAGTSQTAGTPFSTTVTARDVYWNTAITYAGDIRFKSSDDDLVSFPLDLQSFAPAATYYGVRTFTNGVTIDTMGSYWLRAADAVFAFKSGEQKDIVVGPGAFAPGTALSTITVDETNKIAGQEVKVTLTPKDAQGNLLYSCQNITVLLDGAVKDGTHQETHGTVSGADGVYTFYVPVTSTTANNIISAKLGEIAFGQTYDITVTPAPPTAANTLITSTGGMTTDETKLVTVQLYDKYNNLRTTDDGDLLLTTTLGLFGGYSGATTVSAVYGAAGSGSYTATLYASTDGLAGTGTATITGHLDPNGTAGPGDYVAGVSPYLHVAAPWPAHFDVTDNTTVVISEGLPNLNTSVISSALPATMTTDENKVITVQLKDHLGNLIRSDRGTVTLITTLGGFDHTNGHSPVTASYNGTSTGSYSATLYASYSAVNNGVGTATITGSIVATGANGSFADNTTTVEITEGLPAVATNEITAASYAITADQNTLVTVQLKDALSNLITHNRGAVTLSVTPIGVIDNGTSTGASAIAANYAVANNGTYTATFKLNAFGVGNATITGKIDGSANYSDNAIINVTHGAATKLVVYTQPATATYIAGVSFSPQPVIHIKDQWNNINTSDGATVVTAARGSTGTSTLLGTLTATANAGVVTFSNLNYQLAESINIAFTSGSLTSVTSDEFTVVHNVPAFMAITGSPTQTAGVAQTITVKAYDMYNNPATRFVGTKSLTFTGANLSPAPPYYPIVDGVHFGTATPISFSGGIATASMTLYKEETVDIASNHTDAAYTDGITGASALDIDAEYVSASVDNRLHIVVAQAAPAYFAITGNATQVAGVAQTITIRAYDNFNNPATNYSGTKSITFGGPAVSPAPSTSPTIDGHVIGTATDLLFNSSGQATASMVLYKVENILVSSSDGSMSTRTSPGEYRLAVNVTHAPANYYSVIPVSATQTAGTSQNITVTAFDAYNNQATTYAGDVALTFTGANPSPAPSTNPTVTNKTDVATAFSSATTVTFAGGTATRSMALYLVETARIVATSGLITTPVITDYDYRATVAVNHAANTYFAVTGLTTNQTAGTSRDIAITMYDPYNNIATSYAGSKSITFTGAAPSPNTPNAAFSPTANGTVFGSATALTFTAGVVTTVPMVLYNVETAHIVATDGGLTTPSSRNSFDYRLNIGVIHATEDFMTISGTGTQTAGTPQTITVRAYDHYNNLATRYDGAKSLTFSGASASPEYLPTPSVSPVIGATVFGSATSLTFTAGVVTASMNLYKVENAQITATNGTITAGSHMLDVIVSHATPDYLAITGTATQTAGTSQTITVTAYDTYNNLATGYVGSKSLTFSGANDAATSPVTHPTLGGTNFGSVKSLTFAAGVASGSMLLYKTETALISATDGTIEANSGLTKDHRLSVLVGPTLLKDFLVYGVGTTVSSHTEHYYGEWQSVTVEPRDTYNNRKTNYNKTITFTLTDPAAVKPVDYTFTITGASPDNGVHTFTNAVQFSKPSIPYSPGALGWWVTAVSVLEPGKYGYQSDIWVLDRPITITANNATKNYYGDVYSLGTSAFAVTSALSPVMPYQTGSVTVREEVTSVGLTSTGTPATALAGDHPIVTATATGINGFNPDYYNITYATVGTLTVNKRPITISVTPALTQTKVYGDIDPAAYTYAITSTTPYNALVNGDVFSGLLARTAGENVGTYGIDQGSLIIYNNGTSTNKYANYEVTFVGGTFNITPKPITVTANTSQTKIYGNLDPTPFTYTANPAIGSSLPNLITVALSGALTRDAGENVGLYAINEGTVINANNTNYSINYTSNNFSITTKAITVTANTGQTKVYGQVDPTFTYTSNVPLAFSDVFVGALARTSGENVASNYALNTGSLTIEDGDNFNVASNYTISFTTADFAITQLALAVTADAGQSKTYGDLDPTFDYTSVPAVGSSLPNGHTIAFTGSLTRDAGEPVGTYAINQGSLANANYAITYTSKTFAINPLAVTLTANAGQSKEYGDSDPTFTYTSNPIVGFALENRIEISYSGLLDRVEGENVGLYAIGQGTVTNSNYTISYTSNNFAITRKVITITATAGQHKVYGEDDPTFAYTTSPVVSSLPFTASFTGAMVREAGQVVGTEYTITQGTLELIDANNVSGGSLAANYAITFNTADFAITRKPITITVDAGIAKLYGASDPAFTYTSSPVLASLPYGAAFIGSLVRLNTNENVNTYIITQGSLELHDDYNATTSLAQNYTVIFNTDVLTINKRAITIAVNASQSKVYAEADPVFAYTPSIALYYNGVFTGALTRTAGENVATNYAIGRGTLNVHDDNNATTSLDANYDLTFTPANFEITKKPITITVNSGQQKVYGNSDPTFTYVSSVIPLPFSGSFTGSLVRLNTDKDVATNYAISRGSLQIVDNNHATSLDANYNLSFVGDNFEITRRPITLTAGNRTKTYGDLLDLGNTQFGITGDGMAYSETISTVDLASIGTPVPAHIGPYAITTANAVGANGYLVSNYNVTYSSAGTLTIGVRTLHLSSFAADSKTYDGNTVATGIGFIDDRITGDVLSFQRDAAFDTKNVGTDKPVYYTNIAITGGSDMLNYVLASTTGTAYASIFAKNLTITANNDSKLYNGVAYSGGNGVTYNGFINGETSSALTGTLTYGGNSQGATAIGTYAITPGGYTPMNYTYTYVDGTLSIFGSLSVSGTFKYYNAGLTPLSGVNVELWSTGVAGVKIYPVTGTVVTNASGEYSFPDVVNGIYALKATTSESTDGSINSTDAGQANYWSSNPYSIEKVRFYAGDVSQNNRITSQDASMILNYSLGNILTWTRPEWTFWKVGETISGGSPGGGSTLVLPTVTIANSSIDVNFYGLVTGDFNMNFVPGDTKSGYQSVTLDHEEILSVNEGDIFELPVTAGIAMEVGAVSLSMDFPSDKLEILGAYLGNNTNIPVEYAINGNEIRLGWYSNNPVLLSENEKLLTLKVRVIEPIQMNETIRFNLNSDPFNELANGSYMVIDGAVLKMAEIGANAQAGELTLANYPNPFRETTTFTYSIPADGKVTIEICSILGGKVKTVLDEAKTAGNYSFEALTAELNTGIYTATIRVSTLKGVQTRTIKIIRKQ